MMFNNAVVFVLTATKLKMNTVYFLKVRNILCCKTNTKQLPALSTSKPALIHILQSNNAD